MYNISRTIDSKLCKSTDGEKGIFKKIQTKKVIKENIRASKDEFNIFMNKLIYARFYASIYFR